jgi:hypothetical protein
VSDPRGNATTAARLLLGLFRARDSWRMKALNRRDLIAGHEQLARVLTDAVGDPAETIRTLRADNERLRAAIDELRSYMPDPGER